MSLRTLALFGGTFDPIHSGHLQSALELSQRLALDELRLLPCHVPPHRQSPGGSAAQRLAMVELALQSIECEHSLTVDGRELKRSGPSYSIDTVAEIRAELGDQVSISWVMGTDAFAAFDRWHRWQDWLGLAHIVVMARPGYRLPTEGAVAALLRDHATEQASRLRHKPAGSILLTTLTPWPVSATRIRAALANSEPVADCLPDTVLNYIHQQGLYAPLSAEQ